MACHLLGLRGQDELDRSPFLGPVFEGFVASEIAKAQQHHGLRRELYSFRDKSGLEADFVVPLSGARWALIEAKAGRSPNPRMAAPLRRVSALFKGRACKAWVVHRGSRLKTFSGLGPGVEAVPVQELAERALGLERRR